MNSLLACEHSTLKSVKEVPVSYIPTQYEWQVPGEIYKKAKIQILKLFLHYLLLSELVWLATVQGGF